MTLKRRGLVRKIPGTFFGTMANPVVDHHLSEKKSAILVGGSNHLEKYESQWEEISHIYIMYIYIIYIYMENKIHV